jgi:hypothetical protein
MEDKPVTALVLLRPLELIEVKSLPNGSTKDLVSKKQERRLMLDEIYKSSIVTGASVLCAVLSLVVLVLLTNSLLTFLFVAAFFSGATGYTLIALERLNSELRAFRQKVITPELQVGAENELVLSEMAALTNTQIVSWNKRAECAPSQVIDKRFLQGLQKERALLSTNIEEVKRLAEYIKKDGCEPKIK